MGSGSIIASSIATEMVLHHNSMMQQKMREESYAKHADDSFMPIQEESRPKETHESHNVGNGMIMSKEAYRRFVETRYKEVPKERHSEAKEDAPKIRKVMAADEARWCKH